jgi:hypothetical protein
LCERRVNRKERGWENFCFPEEEGRLDSLRIESLENRGFPRGEIAKRPVSRSISGPPWAASYCLFLPTLTTVNVGRIFMHKKIPDGKFFVHKCPREESHRLDFSPSLEIGLRPRLLFRPCCGGFSPAFDSRLIHSANTLLTKGV